MKKFTMFACVALMLGLALSSVAGDMPVYTSNPNATLYGGNANFAKASGDTVDLMGPLGTYKGDFENSVGGALSDGWTSLDITQPTETHWSLDTVNNDLDGITGTSAWCGAYIDACATGDQPWGYDNSWHDLIQWTYGVLDANSSTTVTVTGKIFYDNEPGYDYAYLSYKVGGQLGFTDQASWNGQAQDVNGNPAAVDINESITILPAEYVNGNEVQILFRFQSDGGWSDGDCSWPTRGAVNLDDLNMAIVNGANTDNTFDDFESGWGNWAVTFPQGVGDFAYVWSGLEDADPCNTNYSNQAAFIDDGVVVPGTGGSQCINWCYGPSGYIVTTTGGLAGPDSHIHNAIESPVMTWPNATYDGILYAFNAYRHEDLSADAPGTFYTWSIRSADTDGSASGTPQDITTQPWLDRNFVYYGGPDYLRVINDVTDLMEPGRDEVQLQATVYELGYAWGWTGDDGYPAPYFDNFNVKVFPYIGPGMTTREIDIANDNFPESGTIDMNNPGSLSVRFDMANNISLAAHLRNDPGDSIVFGVVPVRSGAVLAGAPVLHWTLNPNPVFDAYRTSIYGTATTGTAVGDSAVGASGIPSETLWAFDLPDSNFLFPGDVLHYYIEGTDDVGGDQQTSTMPADLTGYGDFSHPLAYNSSYVVHALPTLAADGSQPGILFLNDFANRGGEAEWYGALDNLGQVAGRDYDIYYTNGPSSGVGNGIGGRALAAQIAGYSHILYTSGDLGVNTIANGDYDNDAGDDVGVLTTWLLSGGKCMFMTGDDLASDMFQAGTATTTFLQDYMGLDVQSNDIRPLIDNQATPVVKAMAGNPVIVNQDTWLAYGGCFGINTFDAVTLRTGAVQLAEFLAPGCVQGAYPYSAATMMQANGSTVISMPYDFMFIYNDEVCGGSKAPAPLTARAQILADVLSYCGVDQHPGDASAVPGAEKFMARAYPNPFNPTTKIAFNLPTQAKVSVKIFNLRGELVRTLVDGVRPAGENSVIWDGTSNSGSSVSSGVYFYEARYGNEVQVNKITMVK